MEKEAAEKIISIQQKVQQLLINAEPAHDFSHILRVYEMADHLCKIEGGDPTIALPAALLHDLHQVPKNHPDRAKAADISAQIAEKLLHELAYPKEKIPTIMDAIRSHSFSRGETPTTKEAMIVQDADRLDALGAIGIARLWVTGAKFNRQLYCPHDPFGHSDRELDDIQYGLDHFYKKLLKLKDKLMTNEAKRIGEERHTFLVRYLEQLKKELVN